MPVRIQFPDDSDKESTSSFSAASRPTRRCVSGADTASEESVVKTSKRSVVIKFRLPSGSPKPKPSRALKEAFRKLSQADEMKTFAAESRAQGRHVEIDVFLADEGHPVLITVFAVRAGEPLLIIKKE